MTNQARNRPGGKGVDTNDEQTETDGDDRVPDPGEPKDTDRVTERTESPTDKGADAPFDTEAPGNFVDDERSQDIPEPNEPA